MISRTSEQMFGRAPEPRAPNRNSDTREGYDQRLNHLLEIATQIIAQVGYDKASMRTVAKAAGVSLAGMYHYFDSKEKMLFLIQFRTFGALLNNLREKLIGTEDPVEQLRIMIRSHVTYFAANMAALKVCSHELDVLTGSGYEETSRIRREYYQLTRSIVDRIFQKLHPDSTMDHYVATMALFGMLNWLYRWYKPGEDRSPAGLANMIMELYLNGITGPVSEKPPASP